MSANVLNIKKDIDNGETIIYDGATYVVHVTDGNNRTLICMPGHYLVQEKQDGVWKTTYDFSA